MDKVTYAKLLTHPKWQRKRLEIMQRDNFTCQKCEDEETSLNVHHIIYRPKVNPWEQDNDELITLCYHCHNEIEKLKKISDKTYFDDVRIYKSTEWEDKSRIMFVVHGTFCSMRIYDKDDKLIVGFNFMEDVGMIAKMFLIAKEHGRKER